MLVEAKKAVKDGMTGQEYIPGGTKVCAVLCTDVLDLMSALEVLGPTKDPGARASCLGSAGGAGPGQHH